MHQRIVLPTVVLEIVLGILIGPEGLGWARRRHLRRLPRQLRPRLPVLLRRDRAGRAPRGRAGRSCAGRPAGRSRSRSASPSATRCNGAGLDAEGWLLGVALSTTALGTLVPILADADLLPTTLGSRGPGRRRRGRVLADPRRSRSSSPAPTARSTETVLLLVFGVDRAARRRRMRSARARRASCACSSETVHTTGQAAVRLSVFTLAVARASSRSRSGFDFVLGAFAGGLVVGLALEHGRARLRCGCASRASATASSIPIYFVVTGMNFDLDSLLTPDGPRPGGAFPRAASSSSAGRRRCSGCAIWGRAGR